MEEQTVEDPDALKRCRTLNFYASNASTITARNVVVICKATVLHRKYIDRYSHMADDSMAAN